MVATGPLGEVGRDREDLGAGQRERAIELGEAQVVADRQPDGGAVDLGRDQPVAGMSPVPTPCRSGRPSTATSNRWTLR